ncbi:hypothetical protein DO021_04055 [Desulfobacter hydrogenophilus]|uniref:histidine kinase n=1 Tax=Desulfobacter hydrogenophilus TaxID=2291 RepID=A0A328FF98_9BACT|nr:PAS domain S-box protein [Desulfobacter hydrogenophilus]NDY73213.1 PAS domain S-box protein [Desulfobacter hydrogenophilus]QBH12529.1 PAS domain S-box protein [Desulfobacter hydrogenophilus]RAM03264.1 hypothetical protein DO021_04055 [Desulfobacter hydrogenophilus]
MKPSYQDLEKKLEAVTQERDRLLSIINSNKTGKFQTKEKFNNNEQKFRSLFLNAPLSYQSLDENGNFIEVNEAWLKTMGYSIDEVIGHNFSEFLHPDWKDHFKENFPCFKAIGEILGVEFEMVKKNGDLILVSFHGKIGKNDNDIFQRTHCIFQDITQRKKLEYELKTHFRNLETIFDSAPFILAICDKDLCIHTINRKGTSLVKKAKKDLLGKFCGDVFHCRHSFNGCGCGKNIECPDCILRNSVLSTFETRNSCIEKETQMNLIIDGMETSFYFSISTALLTFDNEERVLLSMADITESKMNEQALLDSEKKYRSMMEALEDPTYICSQDMRIEYMNPAMINWIGEDATGRKCHEAIWGSQSRCPWCSYDRIMKGESTSKELQVPDSDEIYHVLSAPIHTTDSSISKFTSYRNVTEIKQLYSRLQQAQKMEAIGNLAGGIAHDFNNILFPIVGLSEMLIENFPSDSMEYEDLQEIHKAGIRGSELVNQILAFSRQTEDKLSPTRLQFIMKEVFKLIRASIPSNIEINQSLQPNCGLVLADSTQLHQIGMNLITNAYHAVQENGGKIDVEVREVEVKKGIGVLGLPPGKYATLTVTDNGVGIERDLLEKIFEPYFTTKKKGKGTGLGLSVVYGIVKKHKGEIKVMSEPGKRTSFQVYLPILSSSPLEKTEGICSRQPTGSEKILLVDDEPAIANLEKQMLEKLGYSVSKRVSSTDTLDAFRANPDAYDLIISDMSMPHLTGDQLALEILKIRPDIPIIICTGFSENISKEQALGIGIKGFLMKPVAKADMAIEIRRVLDDAKTPKTSD